MNEIKITLEVIIGFMIYKILSFLVPLFFKPYIIQIDNLNENVKELNNSVQQFSKELQEIRIQLAVIESEEK